jgi:hypothetical protein
MSATLWLALVVQMSTVWLLRLGLGKGWLLRPVTVLVLASVVYDGVSQVLLAFPSVLAADQFRNGIMPGWAATANVLLSLAMLAFTVGFLLTGRQRGVAANPADVSAAARVLDWRLLAAVSLPLAVLTYAGRGYGAIPVAGAPPVPPSPSVASTFFVITVTLATVAFVLRHGRLLPALAVQSLVLAAAGERLPIVAGVLIVMLVAGRAGVLPSRRQVLAGAVLGAAAVLAITGVRAHSGRGLFQTDTGFGARAAALTSGLTAPPQPGTPGLIAQTAARFDGVSYAAGILQSHASGQPLLGPGPAAESMLEVVPKALWPSKPETGNALNAYVDQIGVFGLQDINYLPGFPGLFAGCLSWPWLLAVMALLGAAWGWAERRVMARVTAARLVLLAGMVQTAAEFEGGAPAMLAVLRTGVMAAAIVWAAAVVLKHRTVQPQETIGQDFDRHLEPIAARPGRGDTYLT